MNAIMIIEGEAFEMPMDATPKEFQIYQLIINCYLGVYDELGNQLNTNTSGYNSPKE